MDSTHLKIPNIFDFIHDSRNFMLAKIIFMSKSHKFYKNKFGDFLEREKV